MTGVGLTGSRFRQSLQLMGRGMAASPRLYVLAIGGSAIFGAATVGVSKAVGWATGSVVVPAIAGDATAQSRVWVAGVVLVAVAVTLTAGVWSRRVWAGWAKLDIDATHRRRLTAAYLRLPLSWHRAHPAGQLLAHAGADVDAATAVFNPLPFALGVVVMIVIAAAMLIALDPWIAAAALVILPLMIVANVIFQRRMAPAAMDVQRRRGLVADVAHESFEAALLVKSLGTADREEATFAEQADMLRAAAVRAGSIRALFDPVVDLLPNLGTLLVLGVGAWRATAGSVTAGDIVTAAYLLTVLAIPVRSFGWVLGDLPRGLVGYQRIAGVVDRPEVLATGSLVLAERAGGLAVRVEGVGLEVTEPRMSSTGSSPLGSSLIGSSPFGSSSSPAALTLLDDITLSIEPGTTVAIVGATGSGKTTLVSLLARLADPTRGRVLFDGTDLRDLATGEVPGVAALVAQSAFVFEDTVRDNITLGGPYCDDDVWAALRRSRLDDVIAALPGGLDAPLGERGANLSGGQRQRLAIARALVRRPRFLILDDATSAVDPRVEGDILRGIGALGATIVMVAYRMSSVARADLVVHLDAGRIADVGTHEELLGRDEGYRRIATAYLQADRLRDEGRQ